MDAGHGEHGERLTQASRAKLVVRVAKAHPGGLVVRLMDGDPAMFNGLAEEAAACVKAGIAVEVVSGRQLGDGGARRMRACPLTSKRTPPPSSSSPRAHAGSTSPRPPNPA